MAEAVKLAPFVVKHRNSYLAFQSP